MALVTSRVFFYSIYLKNRDFTSWIKVVNIKEKDNFYYRKFNEYGYNDFEDNYSEVNSTPNIKWHYINTNLNSKFKRDLSLLSNPFISKNRQFYSDEIYINPKQENRDKLEQIEKHILYVLIDNKKYFFDIVLQLIIDSKELQDNLDLENVETILVVEVKHEDVFFDFIMV